MTEPIAFLNGRWLPASQATVNVYDAGFVLGATVSEQLRTFGGKLFKLDEHLERLSRSLRTAWIDPGFTLAELRAAALHLVAENHKLLSRDDDLGLSIFVTPGPYATLAPPGSGSAATVGMHTYLLPFRMWANQYKVGVQLVTSGVQQVSPKSWPADMKCRSRMHYFLADREVQIRSPRARALLLDEAGNVSETATANVIAYRQDEGLVSPPRDRILPGISLATVVELAGRLSIPFIERDLSPADLASADEVLLSSTPSCLLPVTTFDDSPIGTGKPGPVFERLLTLWGNDVDIDIAQQARSGGADISVYPENE
jgi:branched-subunit amino acid aminotransferase/4-amino-4-deoxychorismate lyase